MSRMTSWSKLTPKSICLRKKLLDPNERKKDERRKEAERV